MYMVSKKSVILDFCVIVHTVNRQPQSTSVKLSYELGKITFSTGKPKLTPGEVSTFQGF